MATNLVTVKSFEFLHEAESARMLLEAEGIPAFLADAETIHTAWSLANAIGFIKLQVAQDNIKHATELLSEMAPSSMEEKERTGELATETCLACGAAMIANKANCAQCGWSYSDAEGSDSEDEESEAFQTRSDNQETEGTFDRLRSMRRPILMLFLAPLFFGLMILGVAFLAWLVSTILG